MTPQRRPRNPIGRTRTRVAGYIRVSSEEQTENYSLSAQERAIRFYCQAHDWDLIAIYADEGKSAWSDDPSSRPQFAAMLADAELGKFDVVIVHKLDRFARNLNVATHTLKTLREIEVSFVSVSEQMDFTTPFGKAAMNILLIFAELYSDNLSLETRKGKAERKRQGIYNGLLPFGATKGEDCIPIPDPGNLPGLVMAFEMGAGGASDREIARALNETGYRTTGNRGPNPFTKDTVRPMLQNRFYLGELPDGEGGWIPGKHKAMIDTALFDAAMIARFRQTRRRHNPGTPARSPWALSGIATCTCGATMSASGRNDHRTRIECASRRQGLKCEAPSFYAEVVESQIGELLTRFVVPPEHRREFVTLWLAQQEQRASSAQERHRLEAKADRIKFLYLEGDLDDTDYRQERADVLEALAAIPADRVPNNEAVGERLMSLLVELSNAWVVASPEERNKIARKLFADVVIENRTAVAVKPRPELAPFFAPLACQPVDEITPKRKRRASATLSHDFAEFVPFPPLKNPDIGTFDRRKLTDEQRAAIRKGRLQGQSLRQLANVFAVSYATIANVLSDSLVDDVA
jgi:site-specific DNA recombinase